MARSQILVQAGTSVLAIANAQQQNVLTLLGAWIVRTQIVVGLDTRLHSLFEGMEPFYFDWIYGDLDSSIVFCSSSFAALESLFTQIDFDCLLDPAAMRGRALYRFATIGLGMP
ncbi:MAG: hypothetical protein R3E58_17360 [Phycisphaerae bacterium]